MALRSMSSAFCSLLPPTLQPGGPHIQKVASLAAWAGGSRAQILVTLGPDDSRRQLVETVSRILTVSENHIQDQLIQVIFHDWESDPFSLGA